jgi:predicted ArsR family transcriptional regulator
VTSLEHAGTVFGALDDDTRRRVYAAVAERRTPASRADVAADVGISRTLAAFHLDKLANRGLLTVSYARPAGRGGPGAGRPSKLYERSAVEHAASLPARRYDLAGEILAEAVAAPLPRESARAAALRVARRRGVELGSRHRAGLPRPPRSGAATMAAARDALAELGYEPGASGESGAGATELRNCPFHAVVDVAADLVCAVNEALLTGVLEGLGGRGVAAVLDPPSSPSDGRCCVVLRRSP